MDGRSWQGQFRTLKKFSEAQIQRKLDPEHALMGWLAAYASDIIIKYRTDDNGRTPYENMVGYQCRHKAFGFGEHVQFRLTPDKNKRDKFNGDWKDRFYMGTIMRTSEHI